MSFSQPAAPDATSTSLEQQGFNLQAGQQQNQINSYNQSTPYGSLNYASDPNSPSGYSANVNLSPAQQQLLNTRQGTQQTLGNTGNTLATNSSGMYSSPFDLNAASGQTANLLNNWQQQYLSPIFQQQQSNTNAQLQNQGLAPGSTAYNNAQNLLARNQGDITNQYLTQNEGQAFNQALQQYQLPLQTESTLLGSSAPQSPSFQQTPTAQVQPPNFQQAAQNQFADQQQQYQNTMSGLGQLAGAGLGLVGGGMFGGGWGGGAMNLGNAGGTGGLLGGLF